MLELIQIFDELRSGGPSGTPMKEFHWRITGQPQSDKKGLYVRVGSWMANYWFHVVCGKTDKQTLGNARRRLTAELKGSGLSCTFEYREE